MRLNQIFLKFKWQYLAVLLLGLIIGSYLSFRTPAKSAVAKVVTLQSRGLAFQVLTKSSDVAGVLAEQDIPLDRTVVAPAGQSEVFSGMTIDYRTPVAVTVVDAGQPRTLATAARTVQELLGEAHLTLAPKDEIIPDLSAEVYNGLKVVIVRVDEVEETRNESVSFATEVQADPESLYGTETLLRSGKDGEQEVKYFVRYKDGQEVLRKKLSARVVQAPISRVLKVGRKIVVETVEQGTASWYAYRDCLCAAHPYFSKGSLLRVTNVASGKSIIVTVNDVGPEQQTHPGRIIDLDATAFRQLAPLSAGTIEVKVEKFKSE